jgi:hypothetical protein
LTDNPNDLRTQAVNVSSLNQSDLVHCIMKIGAGLTISDVTSIIADGGAVNTDLFNAFPSISGVFDSLDASFDPSKHKVHIKPQPGVALRTAVSEVKMKRVAVVVTGMVVTAVTDLQ